MTDVRNTGSATSRDGDLFDAAEDLGASMARVGTAIVGWPFYLLPAKDRENALEATNNLFKAVGTLHLGFVKAVATGIGATTRELGKIVTAPARPEAKATAGTPAVAGQTK